MVKIGTHGGGWPSQSLSKAMKSRQMKTVQLERCDTDSQMVRASSSLKHSTDFLKVPFHGTHL